MALFPLSVEFTRFALRPVVMRIAPPSPPPSLSSAWLSLSSLWSTSRLMARPKWVGCADTTQLAPPTQTPAPLNALLPVTVDRSSVSPLLMTCAPPPLSLTVPPVTVRSFMVTDTERQLLPMRKTRELPPASTVEPLPLITTLRWTDNCPFAEFRAYVFLVRVIVLL